MKKLIKGIWILAAAAGCGCGDFDDSALRDRIDSYKNRIEVLQEKAAGLQTQLNDLSQLTNGNVITSVSQDSDGKFVVTYKDDSDQEYSVVLATMDEMLDVPVLGVALDEEERVYYWTQTVDGETSWLLKGENGERIPVRGNTPALSVDDEGYWTVNGERLVDAAGKADAIAISILDDAVFRVEKAVLTKDLSTVWVSGDSEPYFQNTLRYHPGEKFQGVAERAFVRLEGIAQIVRIDCLSQGFSFPNGCDFSALQGAAADKAHGAAMSDKLFDAFRCDEKGLGAEISRSPVVAHSAGQGRDIEDVQQIATCRRILRCPVVFTKQIHVLLVRKIQKRALDPGCDGYFLREGKPAQVL